MPINYDKVSAQRNFVVLGATVTVGEALRQLPQALLDRAYIYLIVPAANRTYIVVRWIELEEIARLSGVNIVDVPIAQLATLKATPGYTPQGEPVSSLFAGVTLSQLLHRLAPVTPVDEQTTSTQAAREARDAHPGKRLVVTLDDRVVSLLTVELLGGDTPGASVIDGMLTRAAPVTTPSAEAYLEQQRRFDAAVPSVAGIGQQVRLLAQVRFSDSAPLGAEDWPAHSRPEQLAQGSETLRLRFPRDPASGAPQFLPLLVKVSTLGFEVPEPEQLIDVPPDGFSQMVSFVMEAREQGQIPIDVSVYSLEARPRCLGTARIDTRVGPAPAVNPPLATVSIAVNVDPGFACLELAVNYSEGRHEVSMVFTPPNGRSECTLADDIPLDLTPEALLVAASNAIDPETYSRALTRLFFADPRLRDAWRDARRFAEGTGAGLRVRVCLDSDSPLHGLRWEMLRDPIDGQPLALSERTPISRKAVSAAMASIELPQHTQLRAVLAVASPLNLSDYGLTPIDVDAEVKRAGEALAGIPTTMLARHLSAAGPAQLTAIDTALRDGAHVLYLVCHGSVSDDVYYLWLEDEAGRVTHVSAANFVQAIARRQARPLLIILCACQGAGNGYGENLFALGPQLAAAGVPAVVSFQGNVHMETVAHLLPPLLREVLKRDGVIDRGLAAARGALPSDEWWQAVLWLGAHDGRLWQSEASDAHSTPEPAQKVEAEPALALRRAIDTWRGRIAQLALQSTATNAQPELVAEIAAAGRMIETLEAALRTIAPAR